MNSVAGWAAALAAMLVSLAVPVVAQERTPDGTVTPEQADSAANPDAATEPAYDTAMLMGLNKITARTHPISAVVGEPVGFGTLGITVRACHKARPEDPPKTVAFLEIREYPIGKDLPEPVDPIFSGWMLASSPGLNALEHPVYDVWVTDCRMSSGEASRASE